jgi:hypothetical protein
MWCKRVDRIQKCVLRDSACYKQRDVREAEGYIAYDVRVVAGYKRCDVT